MNVLTPDPTIVPELSREIAAHGLAVIRGLELPATFRPPRTDAVFLAVDGTVEVHVGAGTEYVGAAPVWQRIQAGPVGPGNSRFVGAEGDLAGAFRLLQSRVREAGGEPVDGPRPARAPENGPTPGGEGPGPLRNLVDAALRSGRDLVGRERELRDLVTSLLRETKPGVLLVGPAGCGKTALVDMLAARIAAGAVPEPLRGTPVFELPLGALLEQSQYLGHLEREVRALLAHPDRPIFFVDEIHQIARPELRPLIDLLKPALADGRIRMIGATTPVELRQIHDRAFLRRFTEIALAEPTPEETFRMLGPRLAALEAHHRVGFAEHDVREGIVLAARFVRGRTFPDKAVDLFDHAAALQAMDRVAAAAGTTPVERRHLLAAAAVQAGLPVELLEPEPAMRLVDEAAERIGEEMVGQDDAVAGVRRVLHARLAERALGWADAVATLRLEGAARPLACLLLAGPPGSGKSETAGRLADGLFDSRIIALRGADVGPEAPHGVATWVGAPPGFVGWDHGGLLTDGLRAKRACVVLLDGIERASPEAIRNVLLPLLTDGIVTDRNNGEALHADQCVVVATCDLPSEAADAAEVDGPADDAASAARRLLPAQVVERFDAVLPFRNLEHADRWRVWERQLERLVRQRGGLDLWFDLEARAWVDRRLADSGEGARGVEDLFRDAVVPVVLAHPGCSRLTCSGDGLAPAD